MPASILTMELLIHKSKGINAILVALANNEVHIYIDKNLVDIIHTPDPVSSMKFGKFGREETTLVMTTKGNVVTSVLHRLVLICSAYEIEKTNSLFKI